MSTDTSINLVVRSDDGVVVNRIIGQLPPGSATVEAVPVPDDQPGIDLGWIRQADGSFAPPVSPEPEA